MRYPAFLLAALLLPLAALAATPTDLPSLFQTLISLINTVVPLIFAIAFLAFLWGVFQYFIQGGDDESKKEEGRTYIIYALIGFFVMFGIWGIINVLNGTFGFNSQAKPGLPCFGNATECNTTASPGSVNGTPPATNNSSNPPIGA